MDRYGPKHVEVTPEHQQTISAATLCISLEVYIIHIQRRFSRNNALSSNQSLFYTRSFIERHRNLRRWTKKMYNSLQIIFIFPYFVLHVSDVLSVHHQEHHLVNCIMHFLLSCRWIICYVVAGNSSYNHVAIRLACTNVTSTWYSLLGGDPGDGQVIVWNM